MNHKKIVIYFIILCLAFLIYSIVVMYPAVFGLCSQKDDLCVRDIYHRFGYSSQIMFYYLLSTTIVLTGLYFSSKKVFNAWGKFAIMYIPFSVILIVITPNMGGMLSIDKIFASIIFAGIFLVISLGIIIIKREHHSLLDLDEC